MPWTGCPLTTDSSVLGVGHSLTLTLSLSPESPVGAGNGGDLQESSCCRLACPFSWTEGWLCPLRPEALWPPGRAGASCFGLAGIQKQRGVAPCRGGQCDWRGLSVWWIERARESLAQ